MKIAYLILCHKNPRQLNVQLQELISDGDCYVHIDKKSQMSKEDIVTSERITLVPDEERVDVRWSSNSVVRATLVLINLMLETGKRYDYVCLSDVEV